MVHKQHIDVQVHTCAGTAAVYALLRDGASWPTWTPIDLEPSAEGTRIRWHISFTPKVPGTGWLWRWAIERLVKQSARDLAAYARTTTLA